MSLAEFDVFDVFDVFDAVPQGPMSMAELHTLLASWPLTGKEFVLGDAMIEWIPVGVPPPSAAATQQFTIGEVAPNQTAPTPTPVVVVTAPTPMISSSTTSSAAPAVAAAVSAVPVGSLMTAEEEAAMVAMTASTTTAAATTATTTTTGSMTAAHTATQAAAAGTQGYFHTRNSSTAVVPTNTMAAATVEGDTSLDAEVAAIFAANQTRSPDAEVHSTVLFFFFFYCSFFFFLFFFPSQFLFPCTGALCTSNTSLLSLNCIFIYVLMKCFCFSFLSADCCHGKSGIRTVPGTISSL
jgi:hypothetical protein